MTTTHDIAAALQNIQYPVRIPAELLSQAKASGIVIAYGASDDLMELEGAIRDEFGCYDGGTARLDAKGVLRDWESVTDDGDRDEIAQWLERDKSARSIEAKFAPYGNDGPTWAYETDIPHQTFKVMEEDETYCIGIVFYLADLAPAQDAQQ